MGKRKAQAQAQAEDLDEELVLPYANPAFFEEREGLAGFRFLYANNLLRFEAPLADIEDCKEGEQGC